MIKIMAVNRVVVHYSGTVQGRESIGFRFSIERFATAYPVTGYVKNLSDGRVELVAEGEEDSLKKFLRSVHEDQDMFIDHYSVNWLPATGEFDRFRIIR
jgi:acylphosphatase